MKSNISYQGGSGIRCGRAFSQSTSIHRKLMLRYSSVKSRNGDVEMETELSGSTEHLEKMFYQNMSLSEQLAKASCHLDSPTVIVEKVEEKPVPFKYSISQHYTHTSTYLIVVDSLQLI